MCCESTTIVEQPLRFFGGGCFNYLTGLNPLILSDIKEEKKEEEKPNPTLTDCPMGRYISTTQGLGFRV
jgi:hypothetical protein